MIDSIDKTQFALKTTACGAVEPLAGTQKSLVSIEKNTAALVTQIECCFDGETRVHTYKDGSLQINSVEVGDLVLSRCEKTGERAYRKVLQVFKHDYYYDDPHAVEIPQYRVRYMMSNGRIGGGQYDA